MIITVLGSCANQTALREGVALLIDGDEQNAGSILIDCGPGIVASMHRCGRHASEITTIILTHSHGDHILGFPYLVWNKFYEGLQGTPSTRAINVYGLENSIALAKLMLEGCYRETRFSFECHFHVITANDPIAHGTLTIDTCAAVHTTPTISLSVMSDTSSIVFSSDSLPNRNIDRFTRAPSILFHEGMWTEVYRDLANKAMHATAKDASHVAMQLQARQLVLLHIFPEMIGRERELLSEAAAVYKGPISIPNTGSVYIA